MEMHLRVCVCVCMCVKLEKRNLLMHSCSKDNGMR